MLPNPTIPTVLPLSVGPHIHRGFQVPHPPLNKRGTYVNEQVLMIWTLAGLRRKGMHVGHAGERALKLDYLTLPSHRSLTSTV